MLCRRGSPWHHSVSLACVTQLTILTFTSPLCRLHQVSQSLRRTLFLSLHPFPSRIFSIIFGLIPNFLLQAHAAPSGPKQQARDYRSPKARRAAAKARIPSGILDLPRCQYYSYETLSASIDPVCRIDTSSANSHERTQLARVTYSTITTSALLNRAAPSH